MKTVVIFLVFTTDAVELLELFKQHITVFTLTFLQGLHMPKDLVTTICQQLKRGDLGKVFFSVVEGSHDLIFMIEFANLFSLLLSVV